MKYFILLLPIIIAFGDAFSQPGTKSVNASSDSWTEINDSIPILISIVSPCFERKPVFQWHKPGINVTKYYIQVSVSPIFASTIIYVSVADTIYTPDIDLPFGTIYWRIRADEYPWSPTESFVLKDIRIPSLISHPSPTHLQNPILRWFRPAVAIIAFRIQLAPDSLFQNILIDSSLSDTMYQCPTPLPLGTIYWRVNADSSAYSPTSVFTIIDSRIPIIIPFTPKITANRFPKLQWYKVDSVNQYNIVIDNDPDFSSPLHALPLNAHDYTPFEALPAGPIFWRVKTDLINVWSNTDSFYIQSDSIPFIVRYHGDTVHRRRPVFAWHPVANCNSYKLLFANNRAFNNSAEIPLNDTSYTPTIDLDNGLWFWKVSCDLNINAFCLPDSLIVDSLNTAIYYPLPNTAGGFRIIRSSRGITIIQPEYWLPGCIQANIYDLTGKRITQLTSKQSEKGVLTWHYKQGNKRILASGIYLMHLRANRKNYYTKIIIP